MKASPIVGIAVCFALAFAMLAGAGWTAQTGATDGDIVVDEVNSSANNSPIGITGATNNQDDGDIVGFIVNGSEKLIDFVLLGLTIGSVLANLGFPLWMTRPIGWGVQLVLMVGFAQFTLNRVLR
jgi:hypothetical protein